MTKQIHTEILINATPSKVWQHLMAFSNYGNWNTFIKSIKGKPQVGSKLAITVQPVNSKPMSFAPTVLAYDHNSRLEWLGSFLFKGLFDGKHSFELIEQANGTTLFKHSEVFTGILVGLFNTTNSELGFKAMNTQLKQMVEG
jgi:hypothetical protein